MITSMMSRMADAEKLSIPQLQMAIKNGTIPAYVGVPLLQDKVKQRQQAMAMQQAQQQQGQDQVPLAAQVMQEADQYRGIDELPTNLPTEEDERAVNDEYANGGIIAFADTGAVKEPKKSFWDIVDLSKYQADPAYKAFVDESGETDKTYKNYLELGNTPPLTKDELTDARYKNAFAVEDAYYASPEGKQAEIQAQQMGEPKVVLPSKVREQYWTEATNDPKLSTRLVENEMGLDRGDLARMRGGQTNSSTGKFSIDQIAKDYTDNVNEMTPFQRIENRPTLTPMSEGISNFYNKVLRPKGIDSTLKEGEKQRDVPEGLYPYVDTGMFSQMPGGTAGVTSAPPTAIPQERLPVAGSDTGAFQAADKGITTLPAGQRGAAPTGQRSAAPTGTTTSTGGSRGNGVGGDVPSTLREAEAIAGKSPAAAQAVSAVDRYMAMLEKSGESVGREKKEAFYMALISGGLAAAGGTSPNALANIAAGMVPATQQYQKAIAGIRKDDRERIEKLMTAGISKEKLALELKKLGIEEKKVDALVNFYNAKAAAAGSGGDAAGERQLRLLAFNSGKELTRVEADVARVRNSEEYREAARVLKMPFDPKSASPTIKAMRKNAEDTIGRIDTDLNRRLSDARDTVNFYRKEAGFESSDRTGSAGLPNGIPTGSRLAGKSGGKDVYEAPDGKRYIVD